MIQYLYRKDLRQHKKKTFFKLRDPTQTFLDESKTMRARSRCGGNENPRNKTRAFTALAYRAYIIIILLWCGRRRRQRDEPLNRKLPPHAYCNKHIARQRENQNNTTHTQ